MALRTPILAIVGRPNVGKSTLFNRIVGRKKAVVEGVPGVTRDRNYEFVDRFMFPFIVVDTGGFVANAPDELMSLVVEQTMLAIEEADVIIALFDGNSGLVPEDHDIVDILRRQKKPVLYGVNKCDGMEQLAKVADFYQLGLSSIKDISALSGHGVSAFVECALESLPNAEALTASWEANLKAQEIAEIEANQQAELSLKAEESELETVNAAGVEKVANGIEPSIEPTPVFAPVFVPGDGGDDLSTSKAYDSQYRLLDIPASKGKAVGDEDGLGMGELEALADEEINIDCIRVAIVGRPNVGKSTLLNRFVGEQRAITSSVAGTTRDALDVKLRRDGQDYLIVDTAGIRKQARIVENIEQFSAMRALRALGDCDVAVLVIDAADGPTVQDAKIAGMAHDQGRGLVLVVNKWDLVEKNHKSVREYTLKVREAFKFAAYAPILFISAQSGRRCPRVIQSVKDVAKERLKRIPTGMLNRVVGRAVRRMALPIYRGRRLKLYYAQQVAASPPRIILYFNHPRGVHFSYLRYLKNELRGAFGFEGSEIKLVTRRR